MSKREQKGYGPQTVDDLEMVKLLLQELYCDDVICNPEDGEEVNQAHTVIIRHIEEIIEAEQTN